jgi:hypothetical protein
MTSVRLLCALLVIASGCGTVTGPSPFRPRSMSAQIDGSTWQLNTVYVSYDRNELTVSGFDETTPSRFIAMHMPGPFEIGATLTARTANIQMGIRNAAGQFENWINRGPTSDTVTITRISKTEFTGVFAFTLEPTTSNGGTGQKVAQGQFRGWVESDED